MFFGGGKKLKCFFWGFISFLKSFWVFLLGMRKVFLKKNGFY